MADAGGSLLVTGASGTVGSALLTRVAGSFERLVAFGRTHPDGLCSTDSFVPSDFTCRGEPAIGPSGMYLLTAGVALCAGVDSRAGIGDLTDDEFDTCLRVNCLSGLRVVATAVTNAVPTAVLPVVAFSSDVVDRCEPRSVVYAASKGALEQGIRHAAADVSAPALAVLLVRLPDIGVPMQRMDGTRPEASPGSPSAILERAVERAAAFLVDPPEGGVVEVWTDA